MPLPVYALQYFHYNCYFHLSIFNVIIIHYFSFFKMYLQNLLFVQRKWLLMGSTRHLLARFYGRNIKVIMWLHCAKEVSQNLLAKEVTMILKKQTFVWWSFSVFPLTFSNYFTYGLSDIFWQRNVDAAMFLVDL